MIRHIETDPDESERACAVAVTSALPLGWLGVMLGVIYVGVAVAAYYLIGDGWGAAITIAIIAGYAAQAAVRADWQWRVRRARAADPHAGEPHQIEIAETGLRVWCDHVEGRWTWDGITRVIETPEFYLFLRGPDGGPAIPRRVLDPVSEAELRARIREWSPDSGQHLKALSHASGC